MILLYIMTRGIMASSIMRFNITTPGIMTNGIRAHRIMTRNITVGIKSL